MKKLQRVVLLLILFTFLSTYSPNEFGLTPEGNNTFLKIQNIEIEKHSLIEVLDKEFYIKKSLVPEDNQL